MRQLLFNYRRIETLYIILRTLCALVGAYALWVGAGSFLRGEIAEGWGIASREIAGLIWWITVLTSAGGAVYFWIVGSMRYQAEPEEIEETATHRIDKAGNVLYSPAAEMERLKGLTGDYFFWKEQLGRYKKQYGYEKVRGYCLSQMQKANTTYKQEIEIGQTVEL